MSASDPSRFARHPARFTCPRGHRSAGVCPACGSEAVIDWRARTRADDGTWCGL